MRFLTLLSLCLVVLCLVDAAPSSYVAAVAEVWPVEVDISKVAVEKREQVALAVMAKNIALFDQAVSKTHDAQIVVFPEDGLYGFDYFDNRDSILPFLQVIDEGSNPCLEHSDGPHVYAAIAALSCLARKHRKVLVMDVGEVEVCGTVSDCPPDGRFQYNTQIALDENGVLLRKYRKTHLFPEDTNVFNYPPPHSSIAFFDTSFGVRFGMFICFDIFFQYPSVIESEALQIHDFVFSTYWENDGTWPLITATEMQQAWSRATNASLLASNIGFGGLDSGSGIYHHGDVLGLIWEEQFNETDNRVVVTEVPVTSSTRARTFSTHSSSDRVSSSHLYTPISVPINATIQTFTARSNTSLAQHSLSNGHLECTFSLSIKETDTVTYAMVAYAGPYFEELLYADLCAIVKCFSDDCTAVLGYSTSTIFDSFSISASFGEKQVPYFFLGGDGVQLYDTKQTQVWRFDDGSVAVSSNPSWQGTLLNAILYAQRP